MLELKTKMHVKKFWFSSEQSCDNVGFTIYKSLKLEPVVSFINN